MIEFLETAGAVAVPVAAFILSAVGAYMGFKKKGEVDLTKTLEAAADVASTVRELRARGHSPESALDFGVGLVEKARGHKISEKMKRKARFRVAEMAGLANGAKLSGLSSIHGTSFDLPVAAVHGPADKA